ncbi:MAG: HesA/MoeB/ThiF family protein, partial [Spirochaetota bacterium]
QIAQLRESKVVVAGAGGLGGYVLEMLSRAGVGHLVVIDGDKFTSSNLNRQLLATEHTIGKNKALIAKDRIGEINSDLEVTAIPERFTQLTAGHVISGADVVVDCLDSVESRRILKQHSSEQNIPFIHGAVDSWQGQVTTILPGDKTFELLYPHDLETLAVQGNGPFLPAMIASVQAAECIKLLCDVGELLTNRVLRIDARTFDITIIETSQLT